MREFTGNRSFYWGNIDIFMWKGIDIFRAGSQRFINLEQKQPQPSCIRERDRKTDRQIVGEGERHTDRETETDRQTREKCKWDREKGEGKEGSFNLLVQYLFKDQQISSYSYYFEGFRPILIVKRYWEIFGTLQGDSWRNAVLIKPTELTLFFVFSDPTE